MNVLRINNLSFSYPGSDVKALHGISLQVNAGDFILLCGHSGCGKSTLLRQLKPSMTPYGVTEGEILFRGKPIQKLSEREQAGDIGYVGQNPQEQIVTNKVWHEMAFGLENLGLSNDAMMRRIAEVSEFFGIQRWFDRDTASLSGGEMQMLNLASIMVMQPEILLLDEPTGQLDPIAASDFLHMLGRINRELGTIIIICEHHLEEIFGMVHKILMLEQGELSLYEEPEQAARSLCQRENALYEGLPSALRIGHALGDDFIGKRVPLTIGQGRVWLQDYLEKKGFCGQAKYEPLPNMEEKRKPVIQGRHLTFQYEGSDKPILQDCSITVGEREWFCILGGNGTGKSTLLKVLCQSLRHREGNLEILGNKVRREKDVPLGYEKMVLLPQNPKALFTEITVIEELEETLVGRGMEATRMREAAEMMLEQIGLQGMDKQHPYDLSGGQQQMLALGKMLLLKPKILLMDEPTKGLDPERKKELGDFLQGLCHRGVTILMVSHDIEFCGRYATGCGILFSGQLVGVDDRRSFFAGNQYFTTGANRMGRRFFPEAITCEEVVMACQDL
ncbi:MAG: ATP-binding cassette domain-containing protein [Lachnospiraceae bacterium]|nr:ATP-binding cassette domain-containing protein [Lachnospiraceae bacterium]